MAISMDMKYTALYWALRFVENELDVHVKDYSGYNIIIDAEKQSVNYGDKIKVLNNDLKFLKRHKDFVVLECVDRLLIKGYKPADIVLDGRGNCPDIVLKGVKNIVITKNVDKIGYNPFAGAEHLLLESESPLFIAENGVIYNQDKTHILCATNRAVGKSFKVPNGVTHISRGV